MKLSASLMYSAFALGRRSEEGRGGRGGEEGEVGRERRRGRGGRVRREEGEGGIEEKERDRNDTHLRLSMG